MEPLNALGWGPRWQALYDAARTELADTGDLVPARVVRVDKGGLLLDTGTRTTRSTSHARRVEDSAQWPLVVGDWVAADPDGRVGAILPRRTYLERPSAGRVSAPQPVAANIEVLMIVEPLVPEFSVGRVERLTAMARAAGVEAWVIASKVDLATPGQIEEARERTERFTDRFLAISVQDAASIDELRDALAPGITVVLMGRSGAGKSTLVNALLDVDLATGAVREGDGKGRHTTTHRHLVAAHGRVLIDSPGVRAIAATSDAEAIDDVFDDIAEIARECRFTDCTHEGEPDCAVVEALMTGELSADRLARYRRMQRESRHLEAREPRVQREEQRRASKMDKTGRRQTMRLKGRGGEL